MLVLLQLINIPETTCKFVGNKKKEILKRAQKICFNLEHIFQVTIFILVNNTRASRISQIIIEAQFIIFPLLSHTLSFRLPFNLLSVPLSFSIFSPIFFCLITISLSFSFHIQSVQSYFVTLLPQSPPPSILSTSLSLSLSHTRTHIHHIFSISYFLLLLVYYLKSTV